MGGGEVGWGKTGLQGTDCEDFSFSMEASYLKVWFKCLWKWLYSAPAVPETVCNFTCNSIINDPFRGGLILQSLVFLGCWDLQMHLRLQILPRCNAGWEASGVRSSRGRRERQGTDREGEQFPVFLEIRVFQEVKDPKPLVSIILDQNILK